MVRKPPLRECALVATFLFLCLIGVVKHEMWRDELQAWMIARDSATPAELFRNVAYESHPALWHLLLYAVSRHTRNPMGMQIVHVLIASTAVSLFVFFSPFPMLQKAFFTFSYFPLFEYGIISRNYSLGAALVFLCCVLLCRRASSISIALVIALLCQTSLFGLIVGVCIAGFFIVGRVRDAGLPSTLPGKMRALAGFLILYSGFAFSIVQLKSPAIPWELNHWVGQSGAAQIKKAIGALWRSHVPLPPLFRLEFCESNIVQSVETQCILSIVIAAAVLLVLRNRPRICMLYVVATVALLAFFMLVVVGYLRHQGHLFLVTVACLWLYRGYPADRGKEAAVRRPLGGAVITALLATQLGCGLYAYAMDLRYPFSAARETADYIRRNKLDALELIGHEDYLASAVVGYLDRKAYYAEGDRNGTFILWDGKRNEGIDEIMILEKAEQVARAQRRDVLLIAQYRRLDRAIAERKKGRSIVKVAEFLHGVVRDEEYSLYIVRHQASAPGGSLAHEATHHAPP